MRFLIVFFFLTPAAVNAGGSCNLSDIEIKTFKSRIVDECRVTPCPQVRIVGEIINKCSEPVGVQLKVTARDVNGGLLDAQDFWPASTSNIAPRRPYAFNANGIMDYIPGMKNFTIEIVNVHQWR